MRQIISGKSMCIIRTYPCALWFIHYRTVCIQQTSNSFNFWILGTNVNLSTFTANGGCQSWKIKLEKINWSSEEKKYANNF